MCSIVKTVPPTATDVSPYASSAVKSCPGVKAPSVIENNANATPVLLTGAEKALGYKGIIVNFITHVPAYLQNAQTAAELNGSYDEDYAFGGPENSPGPFATIISELKAVHGTTKVSVRPRVGPRLTSTSKCSRRSEPIRVTRKLSSTSTLARAARATAFPASRASTPHQSGPAPVQSQHHVCRWSRSVERSSCQSCP